MNAQDLKTQPKNSTLPRAPAPEIKPKTSDAAASRHAVVPDFVRFKMHRLGERLDHIQPFSTAYARVLQTLKIAPTPAPEAPKPSIGRARSSSLPGTRPNQAPQDAQALQDPLAFQDAATQPASFDAAGRAAQDPAILMP